MTFDEYVDAALEELKAAKSALKKARRIDKGRLSDAVVTVASVTHTKAKSLRKQAEILASLAPNDAASREH